MGLLAKWKKRTESHNKRWQADLILKYNFMLNKEEIKRYHEDGYIIPEFKMPENDLLEIEKLHDELIKKIHSF